MPVVASETLAFADVPIGARVRMLFDFAHFGSKQIALALGELQPGARLLFHYHEVEEAVFVMEGKGIVTIDGVETPVKAGDGILVPARAVHSLRNPAEADVIRLVSAYAASEVKRFYVEEGASPSAAY